MKSLLFKRRWITSKRALDLAISLPCLVIFGPLVLLIAFLIRIESQGNPFFRQLRVGKNGNYFTLIKIRTLYVEQFGIFLNEEIGPKDYRVTRLGRYLRRSKLDELPQLLNVVLGHMSIVGPRPDIPVQVSAYTTAQRQRLLVKPGLTGIAQISGNTLLSWPDRILLDRWYIENWSFWLDIKIIALTFLVITKEESLDADPFGLHQQLLDKNTRSTHIAESINCTDK